jgi:hypothetical protein
MINLAAVMQWITEDPAVLGLGDLAGLRRFSFFESGH